MVFDNCDVTLVDRYSDAEPTTVAYGFVVNVSSDDANIHFNNCEIKDNSTNIDSLITSHLDSSSDETITFANCIMRSAMLACRSYTLYCDLIFSSCYFTSDDYNDKALFRIITGDGTVRCINSTFNTMGYVVPQGADILIEIVNCSLNIGDTNTTKERLVPSYSGTNGMLVLTNNLLRNLRTDFPDTLVNKLVDGNVEWINS